MKAMNLAAATLAAALLGAQVSAQQPPPPGGNYVTREEYDKLKTQFDAMRQEMAAITKDRVAEQKELDQTIEEIHKDIKENRGLLGPLQPGDSKLLLTGYAFATFINPKQGPSTFDAGFNPIFVWQLNKRLLLEAEVELGFEEEETSTALEYVNISYIVNDYLVLGAGKFLLPFGVFNEKLHPAWINKLPDRPLPFVDGIGVAPEFDLGAYARGAIPAGSTKFTYAVYVVNGPSIQTDPDNAGLLNFETPNDINDNKAVGGRIGFRPIPELEVGYSLQYAKTNASDFTGVYALLQDVDISYRKEIEAIAGVVDLRAEWAWSDVEDVTYPTPGGPLNFDNDRNGGYIQGAYRPSKIKSLKDFEFILRYDLLDVPNNAPGPVDEHRWTVGLDYWVRPNVVVKAAYEFDHRRHEEGDDTFLLQTAVGF